MFQARPIRVGLRTTKRMLLSTRHSIRGTYSVQILDGDGKPTLADIVYADGHVRRMHELAERPNLILNGWLDERVLYAPTAIRQNVRVGSGSTVPAVTDISLDAQVEVGSVDGDGAVGGDDDSIVDSIVGGDEFIESEWIRSKRVTMTADRNLTEFGFSRLAASDLVVRNLFRDELDAPITISLLTGKILQVTHTAYYKYPRYGILDALTIEERDATNALVSSTVYDCEIGFTGTSAATWGALNNRRFLWHYAASADSGVGTPVIAPTSYIAGSTSVDSFVVESYTPGTHFVDSRPETALVTQGNGVYHRVGLKYLPTSGSSSEGLAARFLSPATFEKLNTHELVLPTFRVSWAREP